MDFPKDNAGELLDAAYRVAEFWVEFHERRIAELEAYLANPRVQKRPKTVAAIQEEKAYHMRMIPIRAEVREVRDAIEAAMIKLELDIPVLTYDGKTGEYTWSYPE